MKNTTKYIIFLIALAVIVTGSFLFINKKETKDYSAIAQCLADKGVKFYGAFWCPHCAEQKKAFGSAVKLLPYVECSTADTMGQTQICIDEKIESYPTWVFPNGSRINQAIAPEALAEKAGCPIQ